MPQNHKAPRPQKRSKVALVLAGGGITGAVYEVGALRAINDALRGLTVNDFDIYVGTSAGALICALIANQLTPEEIIQTLDNRHPEIGGFGVGDLFQADIRNTCAACSTYRARFGIWGLPR